MLQEETMLLLPGTGRYALAASIPGDPALTVRGECPQHESGSVLTVRTAAEHIATIKQYNVLICRFLFDDAIGLEVMDAEGVAAVAFLGVELHQLLLATESLSLEIDENVYNAIRATLIRLNRQLVHIHSRGDAQSDPYLPQYFAFIAEHPIPGDIGDI